MFFLKEQLAAEYLLILDPLFFESVTIPVRPTLQEYPIVTKQRHHWYQSIAGCELEIQSLMKAEKMGHPRKISLIIVCLIGVALGGCSRGSGLPLGRVSGIIRLDSNPLPNATITFEPLSEGRQSSAITNSNGHYDLNFTSTEKGALIGEHIVRISTVQLIYDAESGTDLPTPELVPPKYNQKSELTAQVIAGSNDLNFDLSSDGFKPRVPKQK